MSSRRTPFGPASTWQEDLPGLLKFPQSWSVQVIIAASGPPFDGKNRIHCWSGLQTIPSLSEVRTKKRPRPHDRGLEFRFDPDQKLTIGMIRIATMLATLIIGLIAGPAVSL